MRVAVAVSTLLASIAVADLTSDKTALVPGLWPRERRALDRDLAAGKQPRTALKTAGIHADIIERLDATLPGPLLNERYAHALVLAAPNLTTKQRRLFERLVPATDGAQRALVAQRDRLAKFPAKEGDELRTRLRAQFDLQHVRIEKRFWRIVLYALNPAQRGWLRYRQLQPYSFPMDALNHVYQLDGLTPSQAARIQAAVTEYESESAADVAENGRLQAELARTTSAAARAPLQQKTQVVTDRIAYRLKAMIERSLPIYTKEQIAAIDAIPPMTTAADRHRHPGELLHGVALTPGQQKRAHALGQRIHTEYQAAAKRLKQRTAPLEGAQMGADAPQALTMQMMQFNATAERIAVLERAGTELVLDVLTAEQVSLWVVAPHEP